MENLQAHYLIVSFNNEGYLPRADLERLLSTYGETRVLEFDYKRYVGAQIGIHNPDGKRVGKVSHVRNKEYLFVVAREPSALADFPSVLTPILDART